MILAFESEFLEGQAQVDFRAVVVLNGRILALNQFHDVATLHSNALLTLLGLADTSFHYFGYVLLCHVVQVQFLNACHLVVLPQP